MKKILVSVFLLLFYSLGLVKAQEFYSDNFVVSQFGLKAGLPQSSVNDIIQTKDGYIWLATYGGLVRFDGLSFTTFNRSNSEGMGSDRILHLYEDKEGTIWVSTETGFTRFKDGKFKTFQLQNDGTVNAPQQLVQDNEGRIWVFVEGRPYSVSSLGYIHDTVNHGTDEFARGLVHTNNIEGFWSYLNFLTNQSLDH